MRVRTMLQIAAVCVAAAAALALAACVNPVRPAPPQPTALPTVSTANLEVADKANGMQAFADAQCVSCHGANAGGGIGPALAHTPLTFDKFIDKVRTALPPKPAYAQEELSDQAVYDIYGWLQTMAIGTQAQARPPFEVIKVEPGQETLPEGKILGMSLWTGFGCSDCHGAFAQGTSRGMALAGISFPYEMERAKMRQTTDQIPEHAQTYMRDTVLRRLYQWLQEGADPEGGC
jgi:mono/diheme cytochrome c family protein